jgi:hypothetical protein
MAPPNNIYRGITLVLAFLGCTGKSDSQKKASAETFTIIGIYVERFYSGDNGWPEKNLFLGCDTALWNKIKLRKESFDPSSVSMILPCQLLQEIDDSLSTRDSLNSFPDPPQVWILSRLAVSDTGIVAKQKMFTYEKGKLNLWWILDQVLKKNPGAFKTARVGEIPLPLGTNPLDSAWLNTVKQGLF